MSKKKREPMPDANNLPPEVSSAMTPPQSPTGDAAALGESDLPMSVTIEVPLGPLDQGFLSRHIDMQLNSRLQCESMRRLLKGLRQAGEKLEDGRPVNSYADAVKWLLEQAGRRDASYSSSELQSSSLSPTDPSNR